TYHSLFILCLIIGLSFASEDRPEGQWRKIHPTGQIPTNITGSVFVNKDKYSYLITGQVELWLDTGNQITFNNDIYRLDMDTYTWGKISFENTFSPSPRVY